MGKNILVAVAWPYASGSRHLGHMGGAYLPADIFARYNRAVGNKTIMVSGSDAHGTPITVRADEEGVEPIDIVNKYHKEFLNYWERLNISWDNYTTTMTKTHKEVVQDIFIKLHEKGLIYKKTTEQAYDPKEKRFLPDRYVEGSCPKEDCGATGARGDQCDNCGSTLDPVELINPVSKISGTPAEFKKTEHFFLKLSALEKSLLPWLESRKGWRPHVINWSKSFVKSGLQDRAITRDLDWGIEIPIKDLGDGKKIYVWFEAVIGYLSATVEWARNKGNPDEWKDWWEDTNAETYYFVGKDNIPFHAVIWPAILEGYENLNLPTNVPANQYILIKGEKASASKGVGKSLNEYLDEWEPDSLRYCLASILPEQADTEISEEDLKKRNNEELVATWGNLVQRVFSLLSSNFATIPEVVDLKSNDEELLKKSSDIFQEVGAFIEKVELKNGLQASMSFVSKINVYLNENEPWKVLKEDKERAGTVLTVSLTAIISAANVLSPYMPTTSKKVLDAIPREHGNIWEISKAIPGGKIKQIGHLFKKFD
jgi:methionyl-tRNA synthetase